MVEINVQSFKEPRGFIRICQILLAILTFALTSGYVCKMHLNFNCPNNYTIESYEIKYPFNFQPYKIPANCDNKEFILHEIPMSFATPMQFFVATGVLSFLYSLACVVFYALCSKLYETNNIIPIVDLIITALLTILWFAAFCSYTSTATILQNFSKGDNILKYFSICHFVTCTVEECSWKSINSSIALSFCNIVLWVGSLWFVLKETKYFNNQEHGTNGPVVGDQITSNRPF